MLHVVDVTPTNEVEKAGWIGRRLHSFDASDAGSVVPTGFAAYARIDHQREGVLPATVSKTLVEILARHTAAPETPLWLAIWEGYGHMAAPPAGAAPARPGFIQPATRPRNAPRLKLPNRNYLLYRGRLEQAVGWMNGPNLWWPEDRSWFIASEIDLPWTYVGGPADLIAELVADRQLQARRVSPDESILADDMPDIGKRP